jgi:predicted transcriptional regulator
MFLIIEVQNIENSSNYFYFNGNKIYLKFNHKINNFAYQIKCPKNFNNLNNFPKKNYDIIIPYYEFCIRFEYIINLFDIQVQLNNEHRERQRRNELRHRRNELRRRIEEELEEREFEREEQIKIEHISNNKENIMNESIQEGLEQSVKNIRSTVKNKSVLLAIPLIF